MTSTGLKKIKKQLAEQRNNENQVMRPTEMTLQPPRMVKSKDKKDKKELEQIYNDWLLNYLKPKPGFNKDKNTFQIDENGDGVIQFSDPEAEEDFVRYLAEKITHGSITCNGITIAEFQLKKLIDPRTNKEFPKGAYAKLVQQLDAGIADKDTQSLNATAPSPLITTPFKK